MSVRKTPGARRRKAPTSAAPEHHSVSVRAIDNGFIVNTSKSGSKGYESSERYHEKKPTIDIQSIPQIGVPTKKAVPSVLALRKASGGRVKST